MICSCCHIDKDESNFHKNHGKLRSQCRNCRNLYNRKWREENLEKSRAYHKQQKIEWRAKNKDRIKNYWDAKLKNDTQYRLAHYLRGRLRVALKGNYKSGSAVRDLGCSIAEFKAYLESKFQPGMSWDNQGQWHIDHIRPLASFDLTDPNQLKIACHYTNLQPLWAKENLLKGMKYAD